MRGFLDLIEAAVEAQAEIALPTLAERCAGREADIGLIDDIERRAFRLLDPVDGEEQVEGALRRGEARPTCFGKDAANEIARLTRPLDLFGDEGVAVIKGGYRSALHELRHA